MGVVMTAEIIDFESKKYTKLAIEFVRLRDINASDAAAFARANVRPKEYKILNKYIQAEISRQRGSEPYTGDK